MRYVYGIVFLLFIGLVFAANYGDDSYYCEQGDLLSVQDAGVLSKGRWYCQSFLGTVNQTIEAYLTTTYYGVSSYAVIAGTVTGNVGNITHNDGGYDGVTMNITEAAGTPALLIYMNFTNVTSLNKGIMRYYTSSLAGAAPIIQLYEYEDDKWEDYPAITESLEFAYIENSVYDSDSHLNNSILQMRIIKNSTGNINNDYFVDWIAAAGGVAVPSSVERDPYYTEGIKNYYNKSEIYTNITSRAIQNGTDATLGVLSSENVTAAQVIKIGTGEYNNTMYMTTYANYNSKTGHSFRQSGNLIGFFYSQGFVLGNDKTYDLYNQAKWGYHSNTGADFAYLGVPDNDEPSRLLVVADYGDTSFLSGFTNQSTPTLCLIDDDRDETQALFLTYNETYGKIWTGSSTRIVMPQDLETQDIEGVNVNVTTNITISNLKIYTDNVTVNYLPLT